MSWWLAVAACGAAALLLRADARPLRQRRRRPARAPGLPRLPPTALARPAGVAAAGAVAVLGNPWIGLLTGVALWFLLPEVVGRLDRSSAVRLREQLEQQLPLVAGLLAACLASGATLTSSLRITADAVPEPARGLLRRTAGASELGAPPTEIAALLARPGSAGWQGLGAALVRSAATGAPLADLLARQADDALHAWYAAAAAQARAAAVRSVMPLALCYLPAFLLLGVAPLVAGLLGSVGLP